MKKQRTYKGMTAREIIAGRDGETKGGDQMTKDIIWNYRTTYNPDGTPQSFGWMTVCDAEQADVITIENAGLVLIID